MVLADLSPALFRRIITSTDTRDVRSKTRHLEMVLREFPSVRPERILFVSDDYESDVLPALWLGMNAIWLMRVPDRSYWGSPDMEIDKDQYVVNLEKVGNKKPCFIASTQREVLAWLRGTSVQPGPLHSRAYPQPR